MGRKYFADLERVCEVEDTVVEWFDYEYLQNKAHLKRVLDIDKFKLQFNVKAVEVGGIDFSVWRVTLIAKVPFCYKYKELCCVSEDHFDENYQYYDDLKIGISVSEEQTCNEVK